MVHRYTTICSDKCCVYRTVKGFSLSNGLHLVNLFDSNVFTSESSCRIGLRSSFSINADGKVKSTLLSGETSLLLNKSRKFALHSSYSSGIEIQADSTGLGTLSAQSTPPGSNFPSDSDEYDLDNPTVGFSPIPEAIEDIRQGKVSSSTLMLIDTYFTIMCVCIYTYAEIGTK